MNSPPAPRHAAPGPDGRPPWEALAAGLAGEVLLPGSAAYDTARRPAVSRFRHVRPRAVVRCATPVDVAETLVFVRRHRLPVALRSGGHDFAGRSTTTGVLLDVTSLDAVRVDEDTAWIGAGARLGKVYDALRAHGRTLPAGCGDTVGIAGLTLGGGVGILGRAHGLTCDQLLAAEVVLRDGRVLTCDEHHDPDLFWALRGAGALGFAAVTALRFATLPVPSMTGFRLTWPHGHAERVVLGWQESAPDAPPELAASLHVTVRADGEASVTVSGALIGTGQDAAEQLARLVGRVGVDPGSAEYRHGTHADAKRFLTGPEPADGGGEEHSRSAFLARSLPAACVSELVDRVLADRLAGQGRELDFTPWGGAYNRPAPDATAFRHRRARILLKQSVTVAPDDDDAVAVARRWLDGSTALVGPWATGGVYPNFPEPGLPDPDRAYYGANLPRLRRITATL